MKFKVGMAVKVISTLAYFNIIQNKVGTIISISREGCCIDFKLSQDIFAYNREITLSNNQLEFDFMYEEKLIC